MGRRVVAMLDIDTGQKRMRLLAAHLAASGSCSESVVL